MIKIIKNNFILFLVLFTILYLLLDMVFNISFLCPFNTITGLYCPGCGLTRMLKSIIVLDFYQAFRYNPLLFIFFPFALLLIINYIYCNFKNKKSIYEKIPNKVWYTLLIIVIIYWILRNIISYLGPTVV